MIHDIDRTQVGFAPGTGGYAPSGRTVFHENEQENYAAQLMEVTNEQDLEYFLGDLISGAANAVGKFVSSPAGQAIGGVLKGAAKKLLPMAGQALGGYFGGPAGAQIGGQLAGAATNLFETEAEAEQMEWEAANTFVKLAGETVKNAADMPQGGDPHAIANKALIDAAKVHAPQLVGTLAGGGIGPGQPGEGRQSGRWFRHGRRIVIVGV